MMSICSLGRILGVATTVTALVLWPAREGLTQEARVLNADLAVNFVCANKSRSLLEAGIENFMNEEKFNVLNLGRIQRDHGLYLLETQIIGLDSDRDILEFVGLPVGFAKRDITYTAGLRSPPPTRRSSHLEEAVLTFVSKSLDCDVKQVTRGENGLDAAEFYDREVARIEHLLREGEALKKPQSK